MLHLVGILFPHNNDDAQSKSHQILHTNFMPINNIRRQSLESGL